MPKTAMAIRLTSFADQKTFPAEVAFMFSSRGLSVVAYKGDDEEIEAAGTLTVQIHNKDIVYLFTPLGVGRAYFITKGTPVVLIGVLEEEEDDVL